LEEIFQSTPFVRRETSEKMTIKDRVIFQSTPFVRRETKTGTEKQIAYAFQSTPFVRRETMAEFAIPVMKKISIHSLREKGDRAQK